MSTSNLIKYQSKNPIQQYLIKRYFNSAIRLLDGKKINNVVDIGCGEGFWLQNLEINNIGKKFIGLDNSNIALKTAKKIHPDFEYVKGDIYKAPFKDNQFDLVICSEVLEHLTSPELAIKELNRISNHYIFISVPFEPWFRILNFLRGRYISTFGNQQEHINWWGIKGFRNLVSPKLKIIRHTTSLPWQMILCCVGKEKA